jgi:hypothetical protein
VSRDHIFALVTEVLERFVEDWSQLGKDRAATDSPTFVVLDLWHRDTHPIQLPIDVVRLQRPCFPGCVTLLGKPMRETQIVPCSIHHSDHDDLIVFYHEMNDVGE